MTRLDILRGLRISTWEGVWATVWTTLTTGAFQIGFALMLGATPFALGLIAGLPALVGLLQLPASLLLRRFPERRRFVGFCAISGRLLWAVILLIPFVLPRPAQLPAFLILLTVSSALLTVTVPAWTSWMSDLVPSGSRGEYFARRNMVAGIVAMLVPLPAGAFLDQAVKRHLFPPMWAFAALFGIACFAAVVAFTLILRQPEPPLVLGEDTGSPFRALLAPLADREFRPFLLFAACMVCGQTLAGQFFTAWQVDKNALNLSYLTVQILGAVASGAGLAASPVWGYLSDKYGARPMLALGAAGVVVAPVLWLFTRPGALVLNLTLIVCINIFSGVAWGGVGLAQFNLLLSNSPPKERATYVAMFSAATGIVGGVSPVVGGLLMGLLSPVAFAVGPVVFNNYKLLFLLTAVIRVACLFLLPGKNSPHSTRYVLGQLKNARPLPAFAPLRKLSRPAREETRREAVTELAHLRSPLAVEELVRALSDVSPDVRDEAARALGDIGDIRAVPALCAALLDPASGVGELCADALAAIGSHDATPALLDAARGPDARVRVAALRALARLADPTALTVVLPALDPAHPTACETACAVLAAIGADITQTDAETVLPRLWYLLSQEAGRGTRLAAARALKSLAHQAAQTFPAGRAWETLCVRITEENDPAVLAQEAVAVQRLGEAENRAIQEIVDVLLPLLSRPDLTGLAYKQTLEAVGDAGLPDGAFYPFLGLVEFDRDKAASKLWAEIRRALPPNMEPFSGAPFPLDAFTGGDYAETVRGAARLLPLTAGGGEANAASVVLRALAGRAETAPVRAEEGILALLLLRHTE